MSRTDHPRIPGHHTALTKYRRWHHEDGYSEPRGVKMLTITDDRQAIVEGLAEVTADQPIDWWSWGPENESEAARIRANYDHADLMSDLQHYRPHPASGHTNLIGA